MMIATMNCLGLFKALTYPQLHTNIIVMIGGLKIIEPTTLVREVWRLRMCQC